MMTTTIDMASALEILSDAMRIARELDGLTVDDKDGTAVSRTDAARLNRQLLNLADQLNLASSLVRNSYWDGKGGLSYDF